MNLPTEIGATASGLIPETLRAARPLAYTRTHRRRFLAELKDFIRFPSISSQPRHAEDVRKCAAWLAAHLRRIGLAHVSIVPTPRHPVVYADWLGAPGRPTVLIYGHYDVQPADPLREWRTPPFEPTVRGRDLYGRGACDDKGQLFTHLAAVESYLQTEGKLPVNVKCLFEGEEEIGSPHFTRFLTEHRAALAADCAVISDTRMLGVDRPAITYALRGALSLELEVTNSPHDLHSGNFGGAVHNPLQALCEIIARLHDREGRVHIPGFYDNVRRWGDGERRYMASAGPSDEMMRRDAQVRRGWGERGYTLYERATIRPALNVSGITGGYQGPGGKSIIPARAIAKINLRLVPDQDPSEIERLFRRHVERLTPPTVCVTIRTDFRARAALISRRHPAIRAAVDACRRGFGVTPVCLRSGGSIPAVNSLQQVLGITPVLMGFALPGDCIHAPNEKFHLPNFQRGIATCIWFLTGAAHHLARRASD